MNATELNLRNDTVDVKPVSYEFSSENWAAEGGNSETGWEQILPDPSDWDIAQCRAYLDDMGSGDNYPSESNPFKMERADIIEALEELGHVCREDESTETLAEALLTSVDAGDFGDIEDWRETCRASIDENMSDYEPLMSYYYPLPGLQIDPAEGQRIVRAETSCVLVTVNEETVLALAGGGMDLSWDICRAYVLLGMLPPVHFCDLPEFAGLRLTDGNKQTLEACKRSCELAALWATNKLERLLRLEQSMAK
jgi:hypothetical protein